MKSSKKLLIGFLLTFVYSIIVVGLNYVGIQLGALPTILLLMAFSFIYKKITKSNNQNNTENNELIINSEENDNEVTLKKNYNNINATDIQVSENEDETINIDNTNIIVNTEKESDEFTESDKQLIHHKNKTKSIILAIASIFLLFSVTSNIYQLVIFNKTSKEQIKLSEEIALLEEERDKYKTNAEYLDMIYHFSGSAGSVKDVYITSLGKEKGIHLDDKNYIVAKQSNQNVEIVESWLPSEFKIKPLKNGYTYVTFRNTETYKKIDMLIIVTDLSYSQQYNKIETTTSSDEQANDSNLDKYVGNAIKDIADNEKENTTKNNRTESSPNVITPIE